MFGSGAISSVKPAGLIVPDVTLCKTIPLAHISECAIAGLYADGRIAVEEFYDDWLARSLFSADGTLLMFSDEGAHENDSAPDFDLAPFPAGLNPPPPIGRASVLSYEIGRWRGLRDDERIAEVLQTLSVAEKMALSPYKIPGVIMGTAESYVLAEAVIRPNLSLVCRRLRIAYALATPAYDANGAPYDYDTFVLHLAQWFDPATDSAANCAPLDQPRPNVGACPMDAMYDGSRLYVVNGGDAERLSALHLYEVVG